MAHRAALCRTGGAAADTCRMASCDYYTTKRKCLLARAFSRGRQCRVRAAGTVGGKAPGGCKAASDEGNYTTKRKCVLAQTFSRGRQCRVRAAGTVGGKAPGGCKAASDEGNYTTKRKCVLAQTFSRGRQLRSRAKARKRQSRLILLFKQNPKHYTMKRKCLLARAFSRSRQWHIVRLSAARAAQPPILAAWQVSCDHYTTYSRFFKRCTHILTSSAPHPPNIRPCQPRQTALIFSGSSPNYVLLFQRIVPICDYTL